LAAIKLPVLDVAYRRRGNDAFALPTRAWRVRLVWPPGFPCKRP
jgi:hypothetical protein